MKESEKYKLYGDLYFKDGRQKKKYMMCRNKQYLKELRSINGYVNINYVCAGNLCPYYAKSCEK